MQTALGDAPAAIAVYARVLEIDPGHYHARLNRAALFSDSRRLDEALADYEALAARHPTVAQAWSALAECQRKADRIEASISSADRALALAPDDVATTLCKATGLAMLGRIEAAQVLFDRAWSLDRATAASYAQGGRSLSAIPDARAVHFVAEFARITGGDWHDYGRRVAVLDGYIGDEDLPPSDLELAWQSGLLPLAPASIDRMHRSISARIATANTPLVPVTAALGRTRIRVGYLSNKYRSHPGMILTSGLFGAHARTEFEVFGYAFNAGDDEFRRRAESRLDRLVDVSACSDAEIAERIHADGVDITIDLNGYGNDGRPGILARRPSPLQVQYLGYMHSMFADWIDYRVTDAVSEPDGCDVGLQEGRAFLPPSFFPYDDALWTSPRCPDRRAAGLPDAAFVFCAFHQLIKITPREFDLWLALLKACPDAVLWLLGYGGKAEARLTGYARDRGIAAHRLVFAPTLPHAEHLARQQLADLFLDAFQFNAHTMGLDALHARVPILTHKGETWASRIGASYLTAVGLPELITESDELYFEKARALADDPAALSHVTERVTDVMTRRNPFASQRVAGHLDRAFTAMWQRHRDNAPPTDLRLDGGSDGVRP